MSALDNLVQFAPVEPYTATFWTIVDLDPLPFRKLQFDPAHGAFHTMHPFSLAIPVREMILQPGS
jgi:hypothetical protein